MSLEQGKKTGYLWKIAGSYLLSQAGRDYDYEGSGVGEAVRISLNENIKTAGRLEYFDWDYWKNTGFGQWETDISDGNEQSGYHAAQISCSEGGSIYEHSIKTGQKAGAYEGVTDSFKG